MLASTRPIIVLLLSILLLLHMPLVPAIPVPFSDVEKAWKDGLSERDIHAAELPTPSFFHEARRSDTKSATAQQQKQKQKQVLDFVQDFESSLDERTMSAPWKGKDKDKSGRNGNVRRRRKRGLSVVAAAVREFMDRKIVEWTRDGQLGERRGMEDEAPVLRPRGARRWNV